MSNIIEIGLRLSSETWNVVVMQCILMRDRISNETVCMQT